MQDILSLITASPWAISQAWHTSLLQMVRDGGSVESLRWKEDEELRGSRYSDIRDGVAIIPVYGPLMHRSYWWPNSYQNIAKELNAARQSDQVKAVILDIDTPGGMVSGMSEFVDMLYSLRSEMPVKAYISGDACSAGYGLASACDEIITVENGTLGSIGAIMRMFDYRKMDEEHGIKEWNIISTQSPYKRLDPAKKDEHARIQAYVDKLAEIFIEQVARNRGVSVETVLERFGQGDVFVGQDAVDAGLADRTGTLEGLLAEMVGENSNSMLGYFSAAAGGQLNGAGAMSIYLTKTAPAAGDEQRASQATAENIAMLCPDVAEALRQEGATAKAAEMQPLIEAAQGEDSAQVVTGERERIKAILTHESAEGRKDLAEHLAFSTDMDAEAAAAMLEKAPKAEAKPAVVDPLAAAMAGELNPDVGADTDTGEDSDDKAAARSAKLGAEFGIE